MNIKDFVWERNIDGEYDVTCKTTSVTIHAIKTLDGKYRVPLWREMELNYYGQAVPKKYSRFDIMKKMQEA